MDPKPLLWAWPHTSPRGLAHPPHPHPRHPGGTWLASDGHAALCQPPQLSPPPNLILLSLSPRMSACTAQNQELQRKVLHLEKQNS